MHEKAHGAARRFGAGSARNSAAEAVSSEILAFMDDDAWAEPEWLERLLEVYADGSIVAVGGAPVPDYETQRPVWFPSNFDWVFGCAYEGLPTQTAPLRHLIGANMSVRRTALEAVGGFQSVDFDDLDLCMRLAERYGHKAIYYVPAAVVHHYVPAERLTWRYFHRRCFFVNREKVTAFRDMGTAANLAAEREFVLRSLRVQTIRQLRRAVRRERGALRSLAAMVAGIALAGLGHLRGQIDQRPANASTA
jgi:GT2 family glycosyltransferase